MKNNTDIYHIVDENFISGFNGNHLTFMKNYYYKQYVSYCLSTKNKAVSEDYFFCNMRRHKIKLIQACCPYCGNFNILVTNGNLDSIEHLKYCTACGKRTAAENAFTQISRLIRIDHFHEAGLKSIASQNEEKDIPILSYDIYHLELIELTSIIEVCLRDFFQSMIYLKYSNTYSGYINEILQKHIANDFMNVAKANKHLKKGLNIDLHSHLSTDCWNHLIDIVEIRNTLVHNNGMIDKRFIKSPSYARIKNYIKGNLIFLDREFIQKNLSNVINLISEVNTIFNKSFNTQKHSLIANHYFNECPPNSQQWSPLQEAILQAQRHATKISN